MLQVPQYPTYASLPSGTHGDLALVTTGGVGVYQFVGQVEQEALGLWIPAEFAGRLSYVRSHAGVVSVALAFGGTGYAVNDTVQPSGGTPAINATITVDAVSGGVITAASVTSMGSYTVAPSPLAANPMTTVTGSGSTATFDLTMQTVGSPCRISVGSGQTLADVLYRSWLLYETGNGVTPVDVAGAIEFDSGGSVLSNSGLIFVRFLDVGTSAKEYLLVSQTETVGAANSWLITSLWGTTANKVVRQAFRTTTDDTSYFAYSTGASIAQKGQNSVSFDPYETLFSRWSNGPSTGVNAEIYQAWTPSTGRSKTSPNALLEEFVASTGNAQLHLNCINFAGGGSCVGRVREFHLFELS